MGYLGTNMIRWFEKLLWYARLFHICYQFVQIIEQFGQSFVRKCWNIYFEQKSNLSKYLIDWNFG